MKIEFAKEDIETIRRLARREFVIMSDMSREELNEQLKKDDMELFLK